MPENLTNAVDVCVELLDEGTESWCRTKALDIGDGLYKLLPTPDYDPEDEMWAFLPGDIVRLEPVQSSFGLINKGVRHCNPDVIRIDVEQVEGSPFWVKRTNALSLGGGLYKILPTPTYDSSVEKWEFVPGDIVRLKEFKAPDGFTYLVPYEKVYDDGK